MRFDEKSSLVGAFNSQKIVWWVCWSRSAGKTQTAKSRFVLVLHLIGWENGASFPDQSQNAERQNLRQSGLLLTLNGDLF